jgi:hypothetical protein
LTPIFPALQRLETASRSEGFGRRIARVQGGTNKDAREGGSATGSQKGGNPLSIVTILIIIILVLVVLYLLRRVF